MPQQTLEQNLKNLGVRFIATTEGRVFAVVPSQFGRVQSMAYIQDLTPEQARSQFPSVPLRTGVGTDQASIVDAGGSPRPMSGDINTLADLETAYVNPVLQNINNALSAQTGDRIAVGNEDFTRAQLQRMTGTSTQFTQSAADAQVAAGQAAADARDARSNTQTNNTQAAIPFKEGLTDEQKQGITNLSQKPADQWTDTDRANWSFATNGAPVPSPTESVAPPTGDTNAASDNTGSDVGVDPADAKWINDLYKKFFDRSATSAELANWAKENPNSLETFLGQEQQKYGYVSQASGEDKKRRFDEAIAVIDASDLPQEIKDMWKTVVGNYPDAKDFEATEIIDTFNKIKADTIDPFFQELADVAINDLKTSFSALESSRVSELEAERANAGQDIRQTKEGLEKAGMTFSGRGIEELGAQSAFAQSPSDTVQTPLQTPFANLADTFYEGNVNQRNRLVSTSSAARFAANQQALGSQAEKFLGTQAVLEGAPNLNFAPSGVDLTGANQLSQQTREASTLQGIINNFEAKQQLKTNI